MDNTGKETKVLCAGSRHSYSVVLQSFAFSSHYVIALCLKVGLACETVPILSISLILQYCPGSSDLLVLVFS